MGLEEKLEKVEKSIEKTKDVGDGSLIGKIGRVIHLGYAIDVGGALLPKYQKRFASMLDWEEKNITIANALIFGLGTSLWHFGGIYLFGNEMNDSIQNGLYNYPRFNVLQSIVRMGYSQATGKSCPSIGLMSLINIPYMVSDLVKSRRKKN